MQIKVKDTRIHKTAKDYLGEDGTMHTFKVPVAEAKLVLVKCLPEEATLFEFQSNTLGYKLIHYDSSKGLIKGLGKYYKPILISKTEDIKYKDLAYYANIHGGGKFLVKAVDTEWNRVYHELDKDPIEQYGTIEGGITPLPNEVFKVLALPEHFSAAHLQKIVDGKLKDGDKILVECEQSSVKLTPLTATGRTEGKIEGWYITLYLITPKTYTENEVRELLYSLAHTIPGTMLNVAETNNFLHMFCAEKLKN